MGKEEDTLLFYSIHTYVCVYFILYTAPVFMALLSWVGAQVLPFSCKNKDLEKTMLLTDSLTKTGIQGNIQTSKGAKAC